jgi:hypothetical protein
VLVQSETSGAFTLTTDVELIAGASRDPTPMLVQTEPGGPFVLTTDPAVIAGATHAMRVNPVVAELVELCVKHTLPWRRTRRSDVLHSLSRCGWARYVTPPSVIDSVTWRTCCTRTHTRRQSRCFNTHVLKAPTSHVTHLNSSHLSHSTATTKSSSLNLTHRTSSHLSHSTATTKSSS